MVEWETCDCETSDVIVPQLDWYDPHEPMILSRNWSRQTPANLPPPGKWEIPDDISPNITWVFIGYFIPKNPKVELPINTMVVHVR